MTVKGNRIAHALAISRPDIFHWNLIHPPPPGWVYEIKPWNSAETAVFEAKFYANALTLVNIPAAPGPVGTPGTMGVLSAPGGWFVFDSLLPGAIVYQYRKAKKGEGRMPSETLDAVEAAMAAASLTLAARAAAPVVAAVLDVLEDLEFVLAFG